MIDDGVAVDQGFATVEHQRRDAAKRIAGAHLGAVVEAGERVLLKRHTVNIERDRDTSGKWRAVHPDQQHFWAQGLSIPGSLLAAGRGFTKMHTASAA